MGARQYLGEHRNVGVGVAALALAGAVAFLFYSQRENPELRTADKGYFTVDDGATYFPDSVKNVPPFDHDGKLAVRVIVYRCKRHGKEFVSHLERYSPEAKVLADARPAQGKDLKSEGEQLAKGRQFKQPGLKDWVSQDDRRAPGMMIPRCPQGDYDQLTLVTP